MSARRQRSGEHQLPRLAITLGDPRGIGPEITRAALADTDVKAVATFVVIGPGNTAMPVDCSIGSWTPGGRDADAGALAGAAIARAIRMALDGEVSGIVTAPIDKKALLAGGYDYPGHTEMLAELTGAPVAMMLASDRLRVVLATTHIALRDVPRSLSADAIESAARVTRDGLREWFGIAEPKLALCALNPHAGDGQRFGDEEVKLLGPA